jgi:hypothetical protein
MSYGRGIQEGKSRNSRERGKGIRGGAAGDGEAMKSVEGSPEHGGGVALRGLGF